MVGRWRKASNFGSLKPINLLDFFYYRWCRQIEICQLPGSAVVV
jgi:hypothetical protein